MADAQGPVNKSASWHSSRWHKRHPECKSAVVATAITDQEMPEAKLHPLLFYFFRTLAAGSLIIGGSGLMVGIYFWVSSGGVCLGLLILIIDPWLEPALRVYSRWWRVGFCLPFVICLLAFAYFIVFLPSPLAIRARDYNQDYPPATTIGGIEWKSKYSDLRIVFENPTDHEYRNLDFVARPDLFVAAEGKTSTFEGLQVFNTAIGPDVVTFPQTDKTGKISYAPPEKTLFLSNNIRILCDRLPKHTLVEIVLAVVQVPSHEDLQRASNDAAAMKSGSIYGPRTAATTVRMIGSYDSLGGRPHKVDNTYYVELH
jgi:hypothetical protein